MSLSTINCRCTDEAVCESCDIFDRDGEHFCEDCGGEGFVFGDDMPTYNPLWHHPDEVYPCPCCNGRGSE